MARLSAISKLFRGTHFISVCHFALFCAWFFLLSFAVVLFVCFAVYCTEQCRLTKSCTDALNRVQYADALCDCSQGSL